MTKTKEKYQNLTKENIAKIITIIDNDSISGANAPKKKKELTHKKIDSIIKKLNKEMDQSFIPIPESARKKVIEKVREQAKDSILNDVIISGNNNNFNFNFGEETRLNDYFNYAKKNHEANVEDSLDSLGYKKNFTNRFLFTKVKRLYSLTKSKESKDQFLSQMLSYGSLALFIFLPFFTLFLKFFYIRRKFNYVDHLIFVFHVQTVFFMLFSVFFLLRLCNLKPEFWIFIVLFLLHLFLAMKKFYEQRYFKTIMKFLLLNLTYILVSSIGVSFLFLISFLLF